MHTATPGATKPLLTKDPIGTEGEMTPGPDDQTPFDQEEQRREWRMFANTPAGAAVPNLDSPDFVNTARDDREDGLPDQQDGDRLLGMITGE